MLDHRPGDGAQQAARGQRNLPRVVGRYHLPATELGLSQSRTWRGKPGGDRGLRLGGIFSGLCHVAGDPDNVFYCVADRGPNDEAWVDGERRRTFPMPEYSPLLYRIRAEGTVLHVLDQIGIRSRRGRPVTGLPNLAEDERPYAFDGLARVTPNPNGLDVEGLAMGPDRSFWLADEYRPSLVRVARNGVVVARLIPAGVKLSADTDVRAVLPSVYAHRRPNRGFEAVALSADGSRVFAIMESPLDFPDRETGRASRMIRILVLDARRMAPIAEHVYIAERAKQLDEATQGEIRVSDVACVNPTTLLVVERGRTRGRIFQIDLGPASNILGGLWDEPHPEGALEALSPAQLRQRGVTPVRKTELIDLATLSKVPRKIEGLTIVNPTTLAIGNDNDFGFSGFDAQGQAVRTAVESTMLILRLPRPLALER